MKQSKENLLKVMKEMRNLNHRMKDIYNDRGEEKVADEYLIRACEWSCMINLLEDEKFFNIIAKSLGVK